MAGVVFLDIDGVLNRFPTGPFAVETPGRGRIFVDEAVVWRDFPVERAGWKAKAQVPAAVLERALVQRARRLVTHCAAEVVISSTWPLFFSLDELRELLAAAGWPEAPLIGVTGMPEGARHREISHWIRERVDYELGERWLVIDDDWKERHEDSDGRPVVLTDPNKGLTDDGVEHGIAVLSGALPCDFVPPLLSLTL